MIQDNCGYVSTIDIIPTVIYIEQTSRIEQGMYDIGFWNLITEDNDNCLFYTKILLPWV